MKLLGCMLLMGACSLCGFAASEQLAKRTERLNLLLRLVNDMMNLLRYTLPTVDDMILMLAVQPCYAALTFLRSVADTQSQTAFAERWAQVILQQFKPSEERNLLLQIGQTLGSTDLDGQLSALTLCKEQLGNLLRHAEEKKQSHASMYRSMGLLTGLFLVILLI